METIISSIQDYVKIKLFDYFKSDNVQLTTSQVMIILSIVNIILNFLKNISMTKVYEYYYMMIYWIYPPKYKRTDETINKNLYNFEYLPEYDDKYPLWKLTTVDTKNSKYISSILLFIKLNIKTKSKNMAVHLDNSTENVFGSNIGNIESYRYHTYTPIFYHKGDIIYFTFNYSDMSNGVLKYKIYDTFTEFLKYLKFEINDDTNNLTVCMFKSITNDSLNFDNMCNINKNRTFDSIVLKDKKFIISILDKFKKNQTDPSIYSTKNLGFMFYGKYGGCGKTSIISAIANYLNMHIMSVDIRKITTTTEFYHLIRRSKTNGKHDIIVLDEFDHMLKDNIDTQQTDLNNIMNALTECKNPETRKLLHEQYITLKDNIKDKFNLYSLLTVLDGLVEFQGRVIIATTNNPELIPQQLKRPGRFDHVIKLDKFIDSEVKELLCKLYPNDKVFINSVRFKDYEYSPAEIICKYQTGSSVKDFINDDNKQN